MIEVDKEKFIEAVIDKWETEGFGGDYRYEIAPGVMLDYEIVGVDTARCESVTRVELPDRRYDGERGYADAWWAFDEEGNEVEFRIV